MGEVPDDFTSPAFQFRDVLATLKDGDKTPQEMHARCSHLTLEVVRGQIANLRRKNMIRDARADDNSTLMRGDEHVYTLSPEGIRWLDQWT